MRLGCQRRLLLGNPLGQGEQGQDHCLRPLLVDHPRLCFGQRSLPKNIQQTCRQSRGACRHARYTYHITPKSTNTNFRRLICHANDFPLHICLIAGILRPVHSYGSAFRDLTCFLEQSRNVFMLSCRFAKTR